MTIKDGWHMVAGYEVYVEDGCVKRTSDGKRPYIKNPVSGWDLDTSLSVSALRKRIEREAVSFY